MPRKTWSSPLVPMLALTAVLQAIDPNRAVAQEGSDAELPAELLDGPTVTALIEAGLPVLESAAIRTFRLATFVEEPSARVGQVLEPGDELISTSTDVDVEITCPGGTRLRFTNGFRVLVELPEVASCAVNYLSGDLGVLTGEPAEITAGGLDIGVEGTEYFVTLRREDGGELAREVTVFEGAVLCTAPGIEERVEAGRAWRYVGRETAWAEISDDQRHTVSSLYARVDFGRALARLIRTDDQLTQLVAGTGHTIDRKAMVQFLATTPELGELLRRATDELGARHLAVLADPTSADGRLALARAQNALGDEGEARYQLGRAGLEYVDVLDASDVELHALLPRRRFPEWSADPCGSSLPGLSLVEAPSKPFRATLEREGAEQHLRLLHPDGVVELSLPTTFVPGEWVSGIWRLSPSRGSGGALRRLTVEVGGVAVGPGAWRAQLLTTAGADAVVVRDRKGRPIVRLAMPDLRTAARPETFRLPPVARRDRGFFVCGPFDGNVATTAIQIEGRPAVVTSETRRGVVVSERDGRVGAVPIVVDEDGTSHRGHIRLVSIRLEAQPPVLERGQRGVLTVTVDGLEGLSDPFEIVVHNRAPDVVDFGAEKHSVMVEPDAVAGGRFVWTQRLKAKRRGQGRWVAELVAEP